MKKLVILILFLNLLPAVTASILFDDLVDDMETFKVGDHTFYVEYIESNQKVVFKMDDMGGIMSMGECETRESIKYCYEDVNYPQIKVKIESLEPDISIERSFSTTSPYLNEEITVIVTLKNDGDKIATNIKYTDAYPSGLKVYSSGNAKVWEGNINAGEEEKFTYTIKAEDTISFDSTATLSYKFDGNEKTKKSSTVTINVKKPFSISHEISKEAVDKDEEVDYNLTITNEHESDSLTVEKLEITLPSQIDLVRPPTGLAKQENKLTFTGTIEKKKNKNFAIKLKSSKIGKFTISTLANLKISDKSFEEKLEKSFNVGLSYIMPILNITDAVKSNSPYNVFIAVKNYGNAEIKNVSIKVESDLFENIEEKKNIAAGRTYEIFKKTLTAPYTEEDKKHNIKIYGSYTSSSGKTQTFEKSAQLTITAAPKIVGIIKEFNKEEFYPGDEIKVTVTIKNQKNKAVDEVDVSDIFPVEIRSSLKGDVTGYLEKLEPNEEKTIYSYSVVVPKDYKKDEIEFKTNLNVKVDGELVILKKVDKVKILKGEKPAEVEEEQETAEEQQTKEETNKTEEIQEPEEKEKTKENFFIKIINWIKNLFKKKP